MDAWLKAKADQLAQKAQQHVSGLQQSASQLTQGALEGALQRTGVLTDHAASGGNKDLEFASGPLGFRLEGALVVAVEEGRQAAALGLEVGDRLVAVDGYVVPVFEDGDLEGEQRAKRLIKKWMKEMPRPATLTFVPLAPAGDQGEEEPPETEAEAMEEAVNASEQAAGGPSEQTPSSQVDAGMEEQPSAVFDISDLDLSAAVPPDPAAPAEAEAPEGDPQPVDDAEDAEGAFEVGEFTEDGCFEEECAAEVSASAGPPPPPPPLPEAAASEAPEAEAPPPEALSGQVRDLQAELGRERDENRKLAAALQEARQALAQARSGLASEKQQRAAQQKRQAELQRRERVLADEVTRLGQALQAAVPSTAETALQKAAAAEAQAAELQETASRLAGEVEELRARSEAAEGRAASAEAEVSSLRPQLERFSQVHEAELDMLRTEHGERDRRQRQDFEERMAALERRAAEELEQAQREAREARELAEQHCAAAEEAKVEVQAAAVEARASRLAEAEAREALAELAGQRGVPDPMEEGSDDELLHRAASAPALGSKEGEEVSALRAHVEALEARCRRLQGRLQAQRRQPSAGSLDLAEGGAQGRGGGGPEWEARLASTVGPTPARLAALAHGLVDSALRGFTQRLLKHALWLYVFYAHLVVLYAIGASCYAQSGMYSGAPLDSINERIGTAAAAAGARDAR